MNGDIAKNFLRLYKKVLLLAFDLITNDDYIMDENPFFVRQHFAESQQLLTQLVQWYDLSDVKFVDVRAISLRILSRIHQAFRVRLIQVLENHKTNILNTIENVDESLKSLLQEEVILVDKAIDAPNQPLKKNYD